MSFQNVAAAVLATVAASAAVGAAVADAAPPSKSYANCTALHGDFPHGVGRSGARDRVRGTTQPVTNFKRNTQVYNQNRSSDRDGDGVACEKR